MGGFGNKRGGKIGREFKAGDKNTKSLFYKKQKYIIPRDNQTRKKTSHHHTPRSLQKTKQKPIEIVAVDEEVVETFTQIEAAEEVVLPSIISSAVPTEPQMPRELWSTKETNDVGKNGKMASDFMIRRLSGGPLQNPEGLKKL